MWDIEHMLFNKTGDTIATVSVKLVDNDNASLILNNISIDLGNGADVIGIAKANGIPVVSGNAIDDIKSLILEVFQNDLCDAEPGLYRVTEDGVESV